MKKVISVAVFNNDINIKRPGIFWQHVRHLVWGYLSIFPDWELRIHHDLSLYNNFYGGVLLALEEQGFVRLVYKGEEPNICKSMLWRLDPLFDPEVAYVMCRDVDHFPTYREKVMTEQFIASGKALHCVQDTASHTCPMLGGLVGFNTKEARKVITASSVDELLISFSWPASKLNYHGSDQEFMNANMWPLLQSSSCMHSVRGNQVGVSLHLPEVSRAKEVDKGTPYMGTPSCDYAVWYSGLKEFRNERVDAIEVAEKRSCINPDFSNFSLEKASLNLRRVVLAMDENSAYYFFAPIVSLLWQHYVGFCPVVMIVGTYQEWISNPQKKLVLHETRKLGAEIHFIPSLMPTYKPASVAQNSRLFISCLPMYADCMYVMTSDMDMLPLNRGWFNKQDTSIKVHLDYSNVYNHEQYPLCYVGCTIETWREIMKPAHPDNLLESLKAQFTADNLGSETDGMKVWCYDEKMFGQKIKAWPGYPDSCQMFTREGGPPVDRIDRSSWPAEVTIQGKVDCHSPRPAHTSPNWEKIESVLSKILTPADMTKVFDYRQIFCEKGRQLNG